MLMLMSFVSPSFLNPDKALHGSTPNRPKRAKDVLADGDVDVVPYALAPWVGGLGRVRSINA